MFSKFANKLTAKYICEPFGLNSLIRLFVSFMFLYLKKKSDNTIGSNSFAYGTLSVNSLLGQGSSRRDVSNLAIIEVNMPIS